MVTLNKDLIARLKSSIQFFDDFTDDELIAFLKLMKTQEYQEDEPIFKEFEDGDTMYIILKGDVKIHRRMGKKDGIDQVATLAKLNAGECFGEIGLIDRRARSASATAVTKTLLFTISHDTLIRVSMNQNYSRLTAKLYRNFSKMLAKRLRDSNDKLVDLSFKAQGKHDQTHD